MSRKTAFETPEIGPILDLLAKTIKAKKIKLQDVSVKLGKADTWFSGVLVRKKHMYLDDFLAVCHLTGIDPIIMLAKGDMLKYVSDVPLVEIVNEAVRRQFDERIAGQDITLRVPLGKVKKREGDGEPGMMA